MTEIGLGVLTEVPSVPEKPRNVQVVNLPDISAGERTVKLGMHTDTILTLLRTLESLPDKDALKIEGRVLTPGQRAKLENSRAYRFFLSSRLARAAKGRVAVVFERDLNASPEETSSWLQGSFSPSSLTDEVGYEVGYFSAADLAERWVMSGRPNDLLPLVGGVNQFSIGSDTLSPVRLAEIQDALQRAFREQEQGRVLPSVNQTLSNTYSSLLISSLPLKNIKNRETDDLLNRISYLPRLNKIRENTTTLMNLIPKKNIYSKMQ